MFCYNRAIFVVYDELGNPVEQTDAFGELLTVTNAYGQQHTFQYDANGNLIEEDNPTSCITQYGYDADNQLTQWGNDNSKGVYYITS